MNMYLRQTPNAKWFSLVKLPMYIYGAAGKDSTKWINRFLYRMGDAPRIYDPELGGRNPLADRTGGAQHGIHERQVSMYTQVKGKKIKLVIRFILVSLI